MTARPTRITIRLRHAAIPAALLALGACTTPFKADVARFQQLPAPQGQTFVVVASDPDLQGGIEFGQYADLVRSELAQQGYVPTGDPATADLVVSFEYDVDNGRERVASSGFGSGFGTGFGYFGRRGFYGGHRAFAFGYYDPFIYGPGYNDVYSYTVYTSELELKIDRVADNKRLFEGRAEAQSRSNRLPYLVPNLVDAIFTDFPGQSGETVRISIKPEETKVTKRD